MTEFFFFSLGNFYFFWSRNYLRTLVGKSNTIIKVRSRPIDFLWEFLKLLKRFLSSFHSWFYGILKWFKDGTHPTKSFIFVGTNKKLTCLWYFTWGWMLIYFIWRDLYLAMYLKIIISLSSLNPQILYWGLDTNLISVLAGLCDCTPSYVLLKVTNLIFCACCA